MTTYTVASDGTLSPSSPAFPQPTINDVLLPDGSIDTSASGPFASAVTVYVDGTHTLQSLYIGSGLEVDLGVFSGGSLTGTGSITGANDPTQILPSFVSYGLVDINGAIDVPFTSYNQVVVSSGERLDLEGDFSGQSASTVTVAAGGELDINSQNSADFLGLTSSGTLKITAPATRIVGSTTIAGTLLVQGDALNGAGTGTLAARSTGSTYVAALDLVSATLTAPINSLTLGQDAQISFGTGDVSIKRFIVAGSATGLAAQDVVNVGGTLTITGGGTGAANQVAVSQAQFTGGTVRFTVAAADGGASLQNQVVVSAGTTLRNDGSMTIGALSGSTAASTLGATSAGSGSAFINDAGASLVIGYGASLSVTAIQNAGAITVAGMASFLQPFTNSGTVDVTSGTLTLAAATTGSGTLTVENGATLSIGAANADAVVLRSGGLLRLSQPSTFSGTIQAPSVGARIDLSGISATAVALSNGAIVVTTASGAYSLAETGLTSSSTLSLSADGSGGSLITIGAAVSTGGGTTGGGTTGGGTTGGGSNGGTSTALPSQPAYRFFDSIHGTQFLTTSLTETQTIQATRPDLVYQGVGLFADNPGDASAAPVYRFFDTHYGTHFYTASATERDTILATRSDLVSEGIGFYEHTSQQAGDVAVYRFFDSNLGTHFYTPSGTERATILATRPDLIAEGVGFYAPSS